jgi:hypothetical protein
MWRRSARATKTCDDNAMWRVLPSAEIICVVTIRLRRPAEVAREAVEHVRRTATSWWLHTDRWSIAIFDPEPDGDGSQAARIVEFVTAAASNL